MTKNTRLRNLQSQTARIVRKKNRKIVTLLEQRDQTFRERE